MKTYLALPYQKGSKPQTLDIYTPDQAAEAIFVYFHGGGLTGGNSSGAGRYSQFLTDRKIAVVSCNYRLYPDAKYPDFIEDAADAVAWVYQNGPDFCGCNKVYVGGSSAGGYLSMMLCFNQKYLKERGMSNENIAGYFHDAGQPTSHFNVLKEMGKDSRRLIVDETAPLYYIGLEKSYPPMRFIVSDQDMQNRYEQTMLVLSTLKHFGYTGYDFQLMHGRHCAYCKADENGYSPLGEMFYDFYTRDTKNA